MTIQPAGSGQVPRQPRDPIPATPAGAPPSPPPGATPAAPRSDALEISDSTRQLAGRSERPPLGELPAARLRDILDRLADGFYDQPGVRAEVARRLSRDGGPA
jgi:hypothetical protein